MTLKKLAQFSHAKRFFFFNYVYLPSHPPSLQVWLLLSFPYFQVSTSDADAPLMTLLLWLVHRSPGIHQTPTEFFFSFDRCDTWKWDVGQSSRSPPAFLEGEQVEGWIRLIGCIWTVIMPDMTIAFFYTSALLISQDRPLISVLQAPLIFAL